MWYCIDFFEICQILFHSHFYAAVAVAEEFVGVRVLFLSAFYFLNDFFFCDSIDCHGAFADFLPRRAGRRLPNDYFKDLCPDTIVRA